MSIDALRLYAAQARIESKKSLAGFLSYFVIDSRPQQRRFIDAADDWQLDICRNLIPMIEHAAGNRPDYQGPRFAFISLPKGHDKTSLVARMLMWAIADGVNAHNSIVAYAAASDAKQAEILFDSAKNEAKANPWFNDKLRFVEGHVQNATNRNSKIEILNSDAGGASGIKPDIVVCDELVFWKGDNGKKLFDILLASSNKRPNACFIVLTNAGILETWQDRVRIQAKRDKKNWYVNDEEGHRASWISYEANMATAVNLLPQFVKRMFNNVWGRADDEGEYLDRKIVEDRVVLDGPQPYDRSREYILALDFGWAHDRAAAAVVSRHKLNLDLRLDKMWVHDPKTQGQTPVALMKEWGEEAMRDYRLEAIWLDPMQLLEVQQHFEKRIDVVPYNCGTDGLVRLAENLKSVFTSKTISLYEGAGTILMPDGTTQDLVQELAALTIEPVGNVGKYRFQHRSGSHDDMSTVLAIAVVGCLQLKQTPRPDVLIVDGQAPPPGTAAIEQKPSLYQDIPVTIIPPPPTKTLMEELMDPNNDSMWRSSNW